MRRAAVALQVEGAAAPPPINYRAFLEAKTQLTPSFGFHVPLDAIHPLLHEKPHQALCVQWALRGGRRALFETFGLGKSVQQMEILRLVLEHLGGGRALIIAPLGVRPDFRRDAAMLGLTLTFVRRSDEVTGDGLYLTNYESVRDGKLDPKLFNAVSLDEASVLRGFGGTKTFRQFIKLFDGLAYKFVATATPDPNQYIELLAYAAFLEIMDVGQAKTRFFKRNPEKADDLTIHPHKEREFWLWVNSWAVFLQAPSDLGFSDEGYALPPIDIRWHEIPTDHAGAGAEKDGQGRMFRDAALGVVDAAREKRDSLGGRIAKMLEIRAEDPAAHRLIWHDREDERRAIEAAIPGITTVYGSQDLDERELSIIAFSDGEIAELATKPVMAGSGCNFQRHCAWAIFLGIGFKFNDFIQAIHRIQRFLQTRPVRIDLIYTEAEREVRRNLEEKWRRYNEQVRIMTEIIREYRLDAVEMAETLKRSLGVERVEVTGAGYTLVNDDCVAETRRMADNSVDLVVTSIPFGTQYEYSARYEDFGHTDDNDHFWRQMDFLTTELYRVVAPGRVVAVHVKDRITPGGITGFGFETVDPFSDECVAHFRKHGFALLARKTIVTDVVRENNQTYRLGWTNECKDGSRIGAGLPEYLLVFRKPPTDRSNGFADKPVVKLKKEWDPKRGVWINSEGYSRARWQPDAHGFERSSGDRVLAPEDLIGLPSKQVYRMFRRHSMENVYDFEHHVAIGEALEEARRLPKTFMLLPPASWHPDVWTDIARMRTLNGSQVSKGKEMHVCPLQLDIVDRAIVQYSAPGEIVYDPFSGIGTVPSRAISLGRRAYACELNSAYFADNCYYTKAAAEKRSTPTLFAWMASEMSEADDDVAEEEAG